MAKKRGRIVLFLFAIGAASANARADPLSSECSNETAEMGTAGSVDARSIRLSDGRTLRLAGIEPFDVLLPDAGAAKAKMRGWLGELIDGNALRFRLVGEEPDRYGRLSAIVWTGSELVQEVAAREGLALAFTSGKALPCFDRILAAENSARRAHRGFWRDFRLPWASPSALASRIGRFAIFEGRVLSVGNRPQRSYLNFGHRWSEDVTVEIAGGDREAFGGEAALAALAGHRVRLRGFVEAKGGPMIVVRSPLQLEALDSPADKTEPGAAARSP